MLQILKMLVLKRSRFWCSNIIVYILLRKISNSIFSLFLAFLPKKSRWEFRAMFHPIPKPTPLTSLKANRSIWKRIDFDSSAICLSRGWVYFFFHVRMWKTLFTTSVFRHASQCPDVVLIIILCIPLFLCKVLWRHTLFLNTGGI